MGKSLPSLTISFKGEPSPSPSPYPAVPAPRSPIAKPKENADASIVPSLNSDYKTKSPLEKLQSSDETFKDRLLVGNISTEELSILCDDLEATGKAGGTIPDFAAKVGLLSSELDSLRSSFPPLERSMRVAKGLRKKMLGELTLSHAIRNPSAVKELLNNEAFSKDLLSDEEESEIEALKKSVDRRAEEALLALDIQPCQYTQVIYLVGDTTTTISETPIEMRNYKELGFLEAKDILNEIAEHSSPQKTILGGTTATPPTKNHPTGTIQPRTGLKIHFPNPPQ